MAGPPSTVPSKRTSRYLIPRSVVDPRGSILAYPDSPTSIVYPFQGRQGPQASQSRFEDDDEKPLTRYDTIDELKDNASILSGDDEQVLGSTEIFDKDGNIRLVPTPSPNPRDPLNLPDWRKWLAIGSMCFFGSISLAAEIAVAGLTPVFLLEYSGVDPPSVLKTADLQSNPDPLALVPAGHTPVSLASIALLATIPMLSNGFATYLLVPLSTAVGRRPVLLLTSTLSWGAGFWAGASTSLSSHIAARVFHGLGSGAVEALLPLIVGDITFLHQRNKAIAAIFTAQGPMIVTFGILAPYISTEYTWRWVYLITSGIGIFAWIFLIAFVPESRKMRSKEELSGQRLWPVEPGENRTALDYTSYGRRTMWDDIGVFNCGYEWREAANQLMATFKTIAFPAIVWSTLLQTLFGITMGVTGQATSFALLAAGVPFELTGLSNLTSIVTTIFIFLIGGTLSDKVTMIICKRRGSREPEYQLPNLIIPIIFGIAGSLVFGYADQFHLHYSIILLGNFLLTTAPLMAAPVIQSFVMESYPQWAGPVLTNVSTLRVFTSFYFSTQSTTWISQLGAFTFMGYISLAYAAVSAGIPLLFIYGKPIRAWTSGRVNKKRAKKWNDAQ
ncbi:hypothetical protein N0V93_004553 [Gnomoniopsis smithogilvyi]|uniref:Major facilitator superfamily (MFS) profile domain-containing protein n=1 Tax=Gnomoniopsis smithogilvyi TaxID=1191159 RepID=A0A9W8YRP6_9PEZI|nr:hypothetical protein N0V93_004553 [Gnomoniopsis smithogilvyi]